MCINCWKERGAPKIDNSNVREAVRQIDRVYHFHSAGGGLHIVLDDFNIDDDDLDWCLNKGRLSSVERRCASHLRKMTVSERASAVGFHYWHGKDEFPQVTPITLT